MSEDTKVALKRYFVCCSNCGLPCVNSEEVCPICGSTSWGWGNRGIIFGLGLFALGYAVGAVFGLFATRFLSNGAYTILSLFLGVLTILGPILRFSSRKYGEELDNSTYGVLVVAPFIPMLVLLSPFLPNPKNFLYFSYFGVVWAFLLFDNFIFSKRKSPSIVRVVHVIEERKKRLDANLQRIREEIKKIGIGKKSEIIQDVREKLERGRDLIEKEIPFLYKQIEFNRALKMFFLWRNCLLNIYYGLHNIHPNDFEVFDGINKGLRYEIMEVRLDIKRAIEAGFFHVSELGDYIESSMGIHEVIRDALIARRASQVLSEVHLLRNYELPSCELSKSFIEVDCTGEILDQINASYYRLKADSEVNQLGVE